MNDFADKSHLISVEELSSRLNEVTLIDTRPAQDCAVGHIEGAKHLDIYGVSLRDSSAEPLDAFLWIFNNLFGSRGISTEKPVVFHANQN